MFLCEVESTIQPGHQKYLTIGSRLVFVRRFYGCMQEVAKEERGARGDSRVRIYVLVILSNFSFSKPIESLNRNGFIASLSCVHKIREYKSIFIL